MEVKVNTSEFSSWIFPNIKKIKEFGENDQIYREDPKASSQDNHSFEWMSQVLAFVDEQLKRFYVRRKAINLSTIRYLADSRVG